MQEKELKDLLSCFAVEESVAAILPLGAGFINDTFIVELEGGEKGYILQRKNDSIFPNVPEMMNNSVEVVNHLKARLTERGEDAQRRVIEFIPTTTGAYFHKNDNGDYWVVSRFISDSVTFQRVVNGELAYKAGKAIGSFQSDLSDYTKDLFVTLPGFHDMGFRFEQWDAIIKEDRVGRCSEVAQEIEWIESRRARMAEFWDLVASGAIPQRVVHNDTKISNVLFGIDNEALCMIDLDTVMKGTVLNDFGDAVRSYTNTGAEDDQHPEENVRMDLEVFKNLAEGYLSAMGGCLSELEWKYLPFAGLFITYEQVLRFLMDYIDGDRYYKIAYADHNLVRTRAQFQLLKSMEEQYEQMCEIVNNCR